MYCPSLPYALGIVSRSPTWRRAALLAAYLEPSMVLFVPYPPHHCRVVVDPLAGRGLEM